MLSRSDPAEKFHHRGEWVDLLELFGSGGKREYFAVCPKRVTIGFFEIEFKTEEIPFWRRRFRRQMRHIIFYFDDLYLRVLGVNLRFHKIFIKYGEPDIKARLAPNGSDFERYVIMLETEPIL